MEILLRVFLLDVSINFVGWCISAAAKTHKNYDLVGSVSYLLCTAVSLFHSERHLVQKVQVRFPKLLEIQESGHQEI
jgi:hypothetical protein